MKVGRRSSVLQRPKTTRASTGLAPGRCVRGTGCLHDHRGVRRLCRFHADRHTRHDDLQRVTCSIPTHVGQWPRPMMIASTAALCLERIRRPITGWRKIEFKVFGSTGDAQKHFAAGVLPKFITTRRPDRRRSDRDVVCGLALEAIFEFELRTRQTPDDGQRKPRRCGRRRMRLQGVMDRDAHVGRRPATTGNCHTPYASGSFTVAMIASNIARTARGSRPDAAASPST